MKNAILFNFFFQKREKKNNLISFYKKLKIFFSRIINLRIVLPPNHPPPKPHFHPTTPP